METRHTHEYATFLSIRVFCVMNILYATRVFHMHGFNLLQTYFGHKTTFLLQLYENRFSLCQSKKVVSCFMIGKVNYLIICTAISQCGFVHWFKFHYKDCKSYGTQNVGVPIFSWTHKCRYTILNTVNGRTTETIEASLQNAKPKAHEKRNVHFRSFKFLLT